MPLLPWPATQAECEEAAAEALADLFDAAYGPGQWRAITDEELAAQQQEATNGPA